MVTIADGTVGVRQASAPDRLIDNEVLTVGGQTVYRQRVTDPTGDAILTAIRTAVQGTLTAAISGAVALDAATLAALETINAVVSGAVTVSGTVALDAATLAALETINAVVSGTVALDAATLAALETIAVTDGGGSLTVDGSVSVSGVASVDSELTTQDYDSGAGSVPTAVVGVVVPASGGPAAVPGDATNGLDVDVTRVQGNVTVVQPTAANLKVDASGAAVPVTDNGGSLTVDGTVGVSGTVNVDQTNAAEADYDTGAGSVTQVMLGIALPASGGPVAGGTATAPVRVDPTGTTAQPVTAASLPLPSGAATETTLATVAGHLDTVETKLQSLIDATPALTLTARMFARQPTTGKRIWLDTANANHIYMAEAVSTAAETDAVFDGIRIPKDALGNPLGEVQENTAFRWDQRTTDPDWN